MEYTHAYINDKIILQSETFARTRITKAQETELSVLKSKSHINIENESESEDDNFVEIVIDPGETLGSIALKYGCRVSQLKQLNNLIADQDFYALKSIRLPATKYGYLKELIEEKGIGIKNPRAASSNFECNYTANEYEINPSDEENESLLVKSVSVMGPASNQGKEAEKFLQKMDQDIHNILNSTKNRLDTLDEVKSSLTCRRFYPLHDKKNIINGIDCGAKWWSLVVAMFTIGLILPSCFYLFFIYVKPNR